jgi:hypothetical protein
MSMTSSLAGHAIRGIGSMIRDLTPLTDQPPELEAEILADAEALRTTLRPSLRLLIDSAQPARVGDLVLFKLLNMGSYPYMETLWGGHTPFEVGGEYIGVLCECGTTRHIAAEFITPISYGERLELQLVSESGGIGYATGFSPKYQKQHGSGRPADVEILGALYDEREQRVLNTLDQARLDDPDIRLQPLPPTVLMLGVGTDVGKTTAACALINELSADYRCAAIKASGTGGYEDAHFMQRNGAFPSLSFTVAGLPTTYYIPPRQFLNCMYQVFNACADPASLPDRMLHPEVRDRPRQRPEIIVVEHGGDLIWADIPIFLRDPALMAAVRVIVLCSDSAMSLIGAVEELRSLGVENGARVKLFASAPLLNVEGFYRRVERLVHEGLIAGVFDVNKPALVGEKEQRCGYSAHYEAVLSRADLGRAVAEIAELASRRG